MLSALIATSAALAGPPALPPLPSRGIALSTRARITLLDVRGRPLARLEGYHFVAEPVLNSGLPRLRDAAGRRWRLDVAAHRLVPADGALPLAGGATIVFRHPHWIVRRAGRIVLRMRARQEFPFLDEDRSVVSTVRRALDLRTGRALSLPRGCRLASRRAPRWILLCGASSYAPTSIDQLVGGRRRRIVGPAHVYMGRPAGHWRFVRAAPNGTLLAQWSGECESPSAFLIAGGKLRELGGKATESVALGWGIDGRAFVHFPQGICGGTVKGGPGVYAVRRAEATRVLATTQRDAVAFWG